MSLLYNLVYPFARAIAWIVRLWVRWEVTGANNVPRRGGLIVVANHMNVVDILLLVVSLGRKSTFMAKEELFRPALQAFILRNLGSFPIRRGQLDITAMRTAYEILSKGGALVIFPEGTRSSGQLQPALSGSAQIALRSGAPILPVGISGTQHVRGIGWVLARPRVSINFGQTFHLPAESSRSARERRAVLTRLIMTRIAELLPPEYRGEYSSEKVPYEG